MNFELRKAAREQAKIRLGLSGPSGSGKTYSALLIAYGIAGNWDKVAIIDTENRSADLYADLPARTGASGMFNVLPLDAPYAPERFIEAIHVCEKAEMLVVIIDSISHEWEGKGGCLEIQEQLGGKYQNWAEVTPRHRKFIDTILQSRCHIITCARSKTDYAMITENGKVKVEKQGLKDITREGFDYELTADLDLDLKHNARASKDRTGIFMDKEAFVPSIDTGKQIVAWCEMGTAPAPVTIVMEGGGDKLSPSFLGTDVSESGGTGSSEDEKGHIEHSFGLTEKIRAQMNADLAELTKVMTATIGAVPAFSDSEKAKAREVMKSLKNNQESADKLSQLLQTYKAKYDALLNAWRAAGGPTPRPEKLEPPKDTKPEQPKESPAKPAKIVEGNCVVNDVEPPVEAGDRELF